MWVKFGITVVLPCIIHMVFYFLERKTGFAKLNHVLREIIVGFLFGMAAILATVWGAEVEDCIVAVRDAAALTAGLFYGPVAGLIAGVMGGGFRFVSVYFGYPGFTQVACTVATILAGLNGALMRKTVLENHHPSLLLSIAITVVTEVMHMMMVVLFKMNEIEAAFQIVQKITGPFVLVNCISVVLSSLFRGVVSLVQAKKKHLVVRTSQKIQRWLIFFVAIAFILTSLLVAFIQQKMAENSANQLLYQALSETSDDIHDEADLSLLTVTKGVAAVVTPDNIEEIQQKFGVSVIEIVNSNGYVIASSDPNHVFFDMSSGAQSAEFLCLLGDTQEYVQDFLPTAYNSNEYMKYAGVKTKDGFVQVGRNGDALQSEISEQIHGITKNRHVGKNGYIIILDQNLEIVSAPSAVTQDMIQPENTNINVRATGNEIMEGTFLGEEILYAYDYMEGFHIIPILPTEEVYLNRDRAIYINSFLEILVFAIMYVLIYVLVKRSVVHPVQRVNKSLQKITDGDLEEKVTEKETREFLELSGGINQTVDALKRYIGEAEKRIEQELMMARDIQAAAVPTVFPKSNEFEVSAAMHPAKQVGGDFYDVYMTQNNVLNFCIADVSGKGVPAAMFMMRAMTELRSLTESGYSTGEVFQRGNNALCEGNDASMFVTAWQGGLDLETGEVHYTSAGHNPPLLYREGEGFSYLRAKPGFILAGMENVKYREETFQMKPMDVLFLYTDGITEATNENQELYGEERLLNYLNSRKFNSMQEILDGVMEEITAFQGTAPQFDDETMMALKYTARKGYATITVDEAKIEDIPRVTEFVEEKLGELNCSMRNTLKFSVAIDEIFSNIVKYGYAGTVGKVAVSVGETDKMLFVRFQDWGRPWNPLTNRDPDITLSAEQRQIGGLGIYMVKKTMDDLKYKYEKDSNVFTIFKKKETD